MRKLISRMHGGQGGFTLIELLVVIAILGVIAAIVALNVSTFFGRGTVQAANTELHQVQTAIISLMADAESGTITIPGGTNGWWAGGNTTSPYYYVNSTLTYYASTYVYGSFRAAYQIDTDGSIITATVDQTTPLPGGVTIGNPWSGIRWNDTNKGWEAIP